MKRRTTRKQAVVRALRKGLCTGEALARRAGVSPRTLYRYIAELKAAGVPIRGEAGVGYMLGRQQEGAR